MAEWFKERDIPELLMGFVGTVLGLVGLPLACFTVTAIPGCAMLMVAMLQVVGLLVYEGGKAMGRQEAYDKAGWEHSYFDGWHPKKKE